MKISAKTGLNVDYLQQMICEKLPPPKDVEPQYPNTEIKQNVKYLKIREKALKEEHEPTLAYIFDSWFEPNNGVFFLVKVSKGFVKPGLIMRVSNLDGEAHEVKEVGLFAPNKEQKTELLEGMVGYVHCKIKEPSVCVQSLGETLMTLEPKLLPLPRPEKPRAVVFASLFPSNMENYDEFMKSVYKILLEDPAIVFAKDASVGLGNGIRCGFLGELHLEVFRQRLLDDFDMQTICTPPAVEYRVLVDKKEMYIRNAAELNNYSKHKKEYFEPYVKLYIFSRTGDDSGIYQLIEARRGNVTELVQISKNQIKIVSEIPLSEIIEDFNNELKSLTNGYGSFDYEPLDYRRADVEILKITVMDEDVDAFKFIVHKKKAYDIGKKLCAAFKENLSRQVFNVAIRAVIGSRIIAKEEIKAYRKVVTAKCYGGDYSRKKKLLERQKEGKERLREFGSVKVSAMAINKIFKSISS